MLKKVLMCLLLLSLSACAGSVMENTAKGMLVSRTTVIELAKMGDELCIAGQLNQVQCDSVGKSYNQFQLAYNAGSAAMLTWIATGTDTGNTAQTSLNTIHTILASLQAILGAYAIPYGGN